MIAFEFVCTLQLLLRPTWTQVLLDGSDEHRNGWTKTTFYTFRSKERNFELFPIWNELLWLHRVYRKRLSKYLENVHEWRWCSTVVEHWMKFVPWNGHSNKIVALKYIIKVNWPNIYDYINCLIKVLLLWTNSITQLHIVLWSVLYCLSGLLQRSIPSIQRVRESEHFRSAQI